METKKRAVLWDAAVWLLCFVLLAVFLRRHLYARFNSDMAAELMLSRLLAREGGVLSENWWYSTELRVLNTQLVSAPLFFLFSRWSSVRFVSTLCQWLILTASFLFFTDSAGLRRHALLWAAALLLPVSPLYYDLVLHGCYYVPHIAISFTALGLMLRGERSSRRVVYIIMNGLLAFAAGLGGVRQVVILYAPLLAAAVALRLGGRREDRAAKNRLLVSAVAQFLPALAGWAVNTQFLSRRYAFRTYASLSPAFAPQRLGVMAHHVLACLGWADGAAPTALLARAAVLLLLALGLWALYRLLGRQSDAAAPERLLALFAVAALGCLFAIGVFTDMLMEDRYFLPVTVWLLPVLCLLCRRQAGRGGAALTGAVLALLAILGAVHGAAVARSSGSDGEAETAALLCREGYTRGYASFWHADVLTELSDGEIEVWTCLAPPCSLQEWLQEKAHKDAPPAGRVFLLLEEAEARALSRPEALEEGELLCATAEYTVYGFADSDTLLRALTGWERDFSDDPYVLGGADGGGVRTLYPGGISYGPYTALAAGTYEVTIRGRALLSAAFDCTYDQGGGSLPPEDVQLADDCISYRISPDRTVDNVEFRVFAPEGGGEIQLESIALYPVD